MFDGVLLRRSHRNRLLERQALSAHVLLHLVLRIPVNSTHDLLGLLGNDLVALLAVEPASALRVGQVVIGS